MAVCVPPEYEKKGGAKAFADKIIDMTEGFVREKRLNQSGRQDLNLRPLRPERSALAKLSYSPITKSHREHRDKIIECYEDTKKIKVN